tara:strand:- start:184 stop:486 length:303 start_codon:yes stop_codon:yes gene_type:complete
MAVTFRRLDIGRKRKKSIMGTYFPTVTETKANEFCIKNNIRISFSPEETGTNPRNWHISIVIGEYRKGEKINLSPDVYPKNKCHEMMYKTSLYYYEKYRD